VEQLLVTKLFVPPHQSGTRPSAWFDRAIHQALVFLLEDLPPQLHLVIATRQDPHLPLGRLRARDQLTELRAADLRCTSSEAADFLNQVMGLDLSSGDIAELENRTEGWIAGLQLAAISMQGLQDRSGFIKSFAGSHRSHVAGDLGHDRRDNLCRVLCRSVRSQSPRDRHVRCPDLWKGLWRCHLGTWGGWSRSGSSPTDRSSLYGWCSQLFRMPHILFRLGVEGLQVVESPLGVLKICAGANEIHIDGCG
jgi:hypothetical protein